MFERNSRTGLWTTRDIPRLFRYWCLSCGRVSIGILFIPSIYYWLFLFGRTLPVATSPPVIEPVTTTTMAPTTMTPTTEQPAATTSTFPTVQPPPVTLPASTTQPSLPFPTNQPPVVTLPPLTLPPIVGTGCTSYIPVPSQQIISGMKEWCTNNCQRGYCPSSYCICIP